MENVEFNNHDKWLFQPWPLGSDTDLLNQQHFLQIGAPLHSEMNSCVILRERLLPATKSLITNKASYALRTSELKILCTEVLEQQGLKSNKSTANKYFFFHLH